MKAHIFKVDIPRRYAKVSFAGPWGPKTSPAHIRARIDFPRDYPETATPILSMEQPASVTEEVFQIISSEVQSLVEAYMSKQKNSLEAILRYLLGETNLNDGLAWLKLNLTQDLTYSSSDEDDDVGTFANMHTLGMDMTDSALAISNAQYDVPRGKTCGALWANDGRLVFFFLPVVEKSLSILDLSLRGTERTSRNHKVMFEGFGRLYNRSPAPKKKLSTLQTIESDDSGYDDSLSSSSGSYESSDVIGEPRYHLVPSITRRGDASDTQRAISVEDSQKSSGVISHNKSSGSRKVNFISIHDWRALLPSKHTLATQYLLGGPDFCRLNAKIAAKIGMQDVSDAWEFADLIIRDEVPLDVRNHPYKAESILLIARRATEPRRRNDSAVDLSYDGSDEEQEQQSNIKGGIKWANHPFGRWLVKAM
jgi:WD repeat-containing protein 59